MVGALVVVLASATLVPALSASGRHASYRVRATLSTSLSTNLPLVAPALQRPDQSEVPPPAGDHARRSRRSGSRSARRRPGRPAGELRPSTTYTFRRPPVALSCRALLVHDAAPRRRERRDESHLGSPAARRAQLPAAHLHPRHAAEHSRREEVNGTFTWTYPNLPSHLSRSWSVGHRQRHSRRSPRAPSKARATFPSTGEADPTTWNELVNAVEQRRRRSRDVQLRRRHVNVARDAHALRRGQGEVHHARQHRHRAGADRARDLPRLRALRLDDDVGHQPRTAPSTATPTSPGSPTSTAATRCTASSAPPTASPRASAASRCPSPRRRPSSPTRPSARSSPSAPSVASAPDRRRGDHAGSRRRRLARPVHSPSPTDVRPKRRRTSSMASRSARSPPGARATCVAVRLRVVRRRLEAEAQLDLIVVCARGDPTRAGRAAARRCERSTELDEGIGDRFDGVLVVDPEGRASGSARRWSGRRSGRRR